MMTRSTLWRTGTLVIIGGLLTVGALLLGGRIQARVVAFNAIRDLNDFPAVALVDIDRDVLVRVQIGRDIPTSAPQWSADGDVLLVGYRADGFSRFVTIEGTAYHVVGGIPEASDVIHVRLSPDGDRISYTATVENNRDVYILQRPTGEITRISDHPAPDGFAEWSPDGTRLAFTSRRVPNERVGLFIYDLATEAVTQEIVPPMPGGVVDWSWSSDGASILYASSSDGIATDIRIRNLSTGGDRSVVAGFSPAWSPDNEWIAYIDLDFFTLHALHLPTNTQVTLTEPQDDILGVLNPVWSPDSHGLIFEVYPSSPGLSATMAVIDDATVAKVDFRQVTSLLIPANGSQAVWRP